MQITHNSKDMDIINIKSSLYDYSVEFISDIIPILKKLQTSNITYVIDRNVFRLYSSLFGDIDYNNIYLIDAIESKKTMETVMDIISFWKQHEIHKDTTVICIGGGITQDLTTIASNLYLRNIDWYFFPTTLLSMSDSCIGGKCGINFKQYKNQIGVFYPPKKIYIYSGFINTLSDEDYINGWGEILKFSLTDDREFYLDVEKLNQYVPCDNIQKYIHMGLKTKQKIIEDDEFESDHRRVLNYGHTFGHGLETYCHNTIPHGTAVLWGIDVANYLAVQYNVLSESDYLRIKKLIKSAFIKEEIHISDPDLLCQYLFSDKKVRNNKLYFAFLTDISNLIVYPIELNHQLLEYFKRYLETTHEYYND